jgi:hypothetical protein
MLAIILLDRKSPLLGEHYCIIWYLFLFSFHRLNWNISMIETYCIRFELLKCSIFLVTRKTLISSSMLLEKKHCTLSIWRVIFRTIDIIIWMFLTYSLSIGWCNQTWWLLMHSLLRAITHSMAPRTIQLLDQIPV